MALWGPLQIVENNLNIPIEIILLLILMLGSLVFYARDVKIGMIIGLVMSMLGFMFAYKFQLNWVPALVLMLMHIVLLAFSLYAVKKADSNAGLI